MGDCFDSKELVIQTFSRQLERKISKANMGADEDKIRHATLLKMVQGSILIDTKRLFQRKRTKMSCPIGRRYHFSSKTELVKHRRHQIEVRVAPPVPKCPMDVIQVPHCVQVGGRASERRVVHKGKPAPSPVLWLPIQRLYMGLSWLYRQIPSMVS